MNLTNGTRKLKEEKSWEVEVTLVEVVGLGGVNGLAGLMMIIFGKKQNKLFLLYLVLF